MSIVFFVRLWIYLVLTALDRWDNMWKHISCTSVKEACYSCSLCSFNRAEPLNSIPAANHYKVTWNWNFITIWKYMCTHFKFHFWFQINGISRFVYGSTSYHDHVKQFITSCPHYSCLKWKIINWVVIELMWTIYVKHGHSNKCSKN